MTATLSSQTIDPQKQSRQIGSKSKWFHNIDGPTAENMLMQHGVDGSFLARPSASTTGDYTLSVRRDNQVTHVKIQSNGEFFDLYGGDKFATLPELVEHYMNRLGTIKETNGRVIELKHPLINEENLQLHEQRGLYTPWFHKHISGVMAEQMLKDKGKQGSFLVRSSANQANALVLCVLVDQQVLHIRIYHDASTGYDVGGGQKFLTLPDLVDFYRRTPMVDKSGTVVHLKQPFNATRMTASQIGARIQELEQEGGFWEEFEELQRESEQTHGNERIEGGRPENKAKNRFKNILPFDKTRVKLDKDLPTDGSGSSTGDYINANYIKPEVPFPGCRTYIATQGPMNNTVSDFWRMVWQENSRIIVMTTREEERSKAKCHRYWPVQQAAIEFPVVNGAIIVRHMEETKCTDFTVNRFEVQREPAGGSQRTVLLYQYVGWPDHNVPQDPHSVLKLLQDVGQKAKELEASMGPVIVHCSAGIGRTGSVIIIDMLLSYIEANGVGCELDVQKLTHHVRSQRSGMVQTESQYKFVYKAVQCYVASLQQQQQQLQQPQPLVNGHEYTNIPSVTSQQQQKQPQPQQQQQPSAQAASSVASAASAVADAPQPPPRQRQV